MESLKFKIPKTNHEATAEFFDMYPTAISAEEAVISIAELHTKAELIAILGPMMGVASAVIGQWMGLGAGLAGARGAVARENMVTGFTLGVVMGADWRKIGLVKDYFWKHGPNRNPFDAETGKIAQNCHNEGLVVGFLQAHALDQDQKELFWRDIGNRAGDVSHMGDSKKWGRRQWIDWYIFASVIFRKAHVT